jgi:two-component system sensor histidine kinase YesM
MFFVIFLIPATISTFASYQVSQKIILDQISAAKVDSLSLVAEKLEFLVESSSTLAELCYTNELIYGILLSDDISIIDLDDAKMQIGNTYTKYYQAFSQINVPLYIAVYSTNGFEYCTLPNPELYDYSKISRTSWFSRNQYFGNDSFYIANYNDYNRHNEDNYVLSTIRLIRKPSTGICCGAIMINVPHKALLATYSNLLQGENSIYLLDDMMRIVSHPDESLLNTLPLDTSQYKFLGGRNDYQIINRDGQDYLMTKYWMKEYNWYLVEERPLDNLISSLNAMQLRLTLLYLVNCSLCAVIALLFAKSISKPLRDFCGSMDEVMNNGLDMVSKIRGYVEIVQINTKFNQLMQRIRDLLHQVQTKEKAIHRAELDQLRMQINPHFLYNTLFSIRCMVDMEKNAEAAEMIAILSGLLKTILQTKQDLISLEKGLEHIKQYVRLQRLRYGAEIDLTIEVSAHFLHCQIPLMSMQPLVENSILHGIEEGKCLNITIIAYPVEDDIKICIHDSGRGIDSEHLELIRARISQGEANPDNIGIANISNRVKLLFGPTYGLSIQSQKDKGTTVELLLPQIF